MKKLALIALLIGSFGLIQPAQAQENYTEGPVWVVNYYRTKPGKFDEYVKFLRANYAKTVARQKQANIIVDSKVLLNPTIGGPDDWDVAIAYLYADFSKLNYSQAVEDQQQKFAAEISGENDRGKREATNDSNRFPLRDYLRTRMLREVTLKP